MKTAVHLLFALSIGLTAPTLPVHATGNATNAQQDSEGSARAHALLDRAERHLLEKGDEALASFSRAGEFVEGELYVYAIDRKGNLLASGGSSITLIGRNITDLQDSEGRAFVREILEGAHTQGGGIVKYRWRNQTTGRDEPKIATYRIVGERILVVGYHAPFGTIELAKSLLWRAAHQYKIRGNAAFEHFNSLNGGFVQDGLYVFVIGLDDEMMYANGGHPRLVGRKAGELTDTKGERFVREMIDVARMKGEGEIQYTWSNPLTRKVEQKRSHVIRVDNYLFGVGAYTGLAR
jgi:cytochrome c